MAANLAREWTSRGARSRLLGPTHIPYVDDAVRVEIGPRFIKEMEAAIALLKMCDKFWTCVAERDGYVEPKGKKPKHCYLPKN
jgi:hypothetical protein